MNDFWSKILAGLMIAGILAGSGAVIAVAKLETKVENQDYMIKDMRKDIKEILRRIPK